MNSDLATQMEKCGPGGKRYIGARTPAGWSDAGPGGQIKTGFLRPSCTLSHFPTFLHIRQELGLRAVWERGRMHSARCWATWPCDGSVALPLRLCRQARRGRGVAKVSSPVLEIKSPLSGRTWRDAFLEFNRRYVTTRRVIFIGFRALRAQRMAPPK